MTQSTQKAHQLKNDFGELAEKVVDEIISAIDWHEYETPNKEFEFWQEVKNELKKIK